MNKQYIDEFIITNNIRPADAVVVKKDFFGILDHYVIYLGKHLDEHIFVASYTKGIKLLAITKLLQFLNKYSPIKINKFVGNEYQRKQAIERATSRLNEDSYNLILNNCEHYYNFVHYGIEVSDQVKDWGIGLMTVGAATTLIGAVKENKAAQIIGGVAAGTGLLLLIMDAFNTKNK